MNRRELLAGAICLSAATVFSTPMLAVAPIDYPHERLSEVWDIMRRTRGGPRAMRAAVERVFGAGILRFSKGATNPIVVLLDTTSIGWWSELEGPKRFAAVKYNIVGGLERERGGCRWRENPILCIEFDSP